MILPEPTSSKRPMPEPKPTHDPIDREIGLAIRLRRKAQGLTQRQLAETIGVSHQQVRKYETGQDRVAVPILIAMGEALGCAASALLPEASRDQPNQGGAWPDPTPDGRELLVSYRQMPVDLRRALITVLKGLAEPA